MAIEDKRFLDYEGLSLYDHLLRTEVSGNIRVVDTKLNTIATYENSELSGGLVKEYVDNKFEDYIEGTTEEMPLYYEMEWDEVLSDYVNVYNYDEAEGTAIDGEIYYERTGTGSTLDPYRYVEADPQPAVGDSVEGLYTQGDPKTIVNPTEAERDYPVIDPNTGEQETQTVVIVNDATKEAVLNIMAQDATISDQEIIDLFEE